MLLQEGTRSRDAKKDRMKVPSRDGSNLHEVLKQLDDGQSNEVRKDG